MKQTKKQNNQNKLRNKFLKSGVKMIGPETIFFSKDTKIGKNVTVGGQVGFAGHIKIGDNAIIAARSGVTKNIKNNSVVAGFPAIDIKEWKKNIVRNRKNEY